MTIRDLFRKRKKLNSQVCETEPTNQEESLHQRDFSELNKSRYNFTHVKWNNPTMLDAIDSGSIHFMRKKFENAP